MSLKNNAVDIATVSVQVNQAKNKIGKVLSIIFSIIFLVVAIIAFFFSWVVGLVCLGVSLMFFGFSKLSKFAHKVNEENIQKLQEMKDPEPRGNI